jgi:hypothetical protein
MERGIERGLEKCLEKGLRAGVRIVLDLRFPEQGQRLLAQAGGVHSTELLTEFLELCKTARGPEELQAFLEQANQK